jgi:hypothetical protein
MTTAPPTVAFPVGTTALPPRGIVIVSSVYRASLRPRTQLVHGSPFTDRNHRVPSGTRFELADQLALRGNRVARIKTLTLDMSLASPLAKQSKFLTFVPVVNCPVQTGERSYQTVCRWLSSAYFLTDRTTARGAETRGGLTDLCMYQCHWDK